MKIMSPTVVLGLGLFAGTVQAAPLDMDKIVVDPIVTGLGTPWGMAFIDTHHLLVTSKSGALHRVDIRTGEKTAIKQTPDDIIITGQAGFLDVAVAPDYTDSGWIYFTYSKAIDGQGATTLARAKLTQNKLTGWQDLLVTDSRTGKGQHYGSRIVFDAQGHVFFGIGDRGERDQAQDLSRHNGKVLRLNLDGSVPKDNPFVGQENVRPEIWSYGHRNPQGLFYNRKTNSLWEIEHGPRGGDEINLIKPGQNYGWPEASQGKEYWGPVAVGEPEVAGMVNAKKVYIPSIAPSGLIQYQGTAFPSLQGDLLTGAMALQHLNHIELDGQNPVEEYRYFEDKKARIRNVIEAGNGYLYLATDAGEIWQVKPKN
ncbi:PQQ-dependent oxidoreductase, gdhB family [Methylophaga frappieri]|uniref:PQQ-dependent oxidoreductase, gdhB family n=1 Tax=Methylophaga frappieri (strain ATCC BAA-2434 / DSM 25690 / JAM7) TaxID=754477 RepID=I1YL29_METFJ|nr:PQQ-dependent sugar dehydrogenase [Methylophaga frappieri]AFJ03622.1 PQQ-dependent oxidoreductase, gdhB family [Methylophaga frappieri]